jgi:hypothetical protein
VPRSRWSIVVVFAAWTLLVWATRLDNIWSDDTLTTSGKVGRTLLAVSFVALAGALVGVAVRTFRRAATLADRRVVQVAAAWTIGVWVVRAAGIVASDHELAFVMVHVVLGLVSAAVAIGAVWALGPARSTADPPIGVPAG